MLPTIGWICATIGIGRMVQQGLMDCSDGLDDKNGFLFIALRVASGLAATAACILAVILSLFLLGGSVGPLGK